MRTNIFADNHISFNSNEYLSKEELFTDIGIILNILTKNWYQCSFRYDDAGIYILEFDLFNPELGCPSIYWLDNEQIEIITSCEEEES